MHKFFCLLASIGALTACSGLNKSVGLEDDNLLEEAAEEAVRVETGVDVDFTPNSLENNNRATSPVGLDPEYR